MALNPSSSGVASGLTRECFFFPFATGCHGAYIHPFILPRKGESDFDRRIIWE